MKTKLMTHVVAGYPNLKLTNKLILAMDNAGASIIEVQIPFSDPIADGPTIMAANQTALKQGVSTDDVFSLIKSIQPKISAKIVIMTYFNVVFAYGIKSFCQKAKLAGVYGLIVPDIPLDEEPNDSFLESCKLSGLKAIQIISPITTPDRLKKIAKVANGFVYCVTGVGTTGAKTNLDLNLSKYIEQVRSHINLPVALGFGISNAEQVILASRFADIVVVGSKLIDLYNNRPGPDEERVKIVAEFVRGLAESLKHDCTL